jgi:hypothetical protein
MTVAMPRSRRLVSIVSVLALVVAPAVAHAAPATTPGSVDEQNVAWLDHVPTPSPIAGAGGAAVTGLAFIRYPGRHDSASDVMFGNGPLGLASWSLADPAHPTLLDVLPASALALPGDDAAQGFWEGEHLQADPARKLVLMSRDPRAFGGNKQTGTSAIYLIDARNPRQLRLITTQVEPGGHTLQCIDGCRYVWSGGPSHTGNPPIPASWNGVPAFVTNLSNPRRLYTYPTAVDLGRNDGVTDYVHDTDVDAAGIAWTSGNGGVRGYWTSGIHYDPVAHRVRVATPYDPVPYAGGKIISPNDPSYIFDHNSYRPLNSLGGFAPGELLFVTDEDFGATCEDSGHLLVVSLAGSHHGEGWRSTPENPFRLTVVGEWSPAGQPGFQASADDDCSAHWFEPMPGVGDGNIIVQAYYGQGTRFLDISDPTRPRQVGYFAPTGSEAATPAYHDGLVYAAQYSGGIDVVRYTPPSS